MTNDEVDDHYGSVNIAENDSSPLVGVKLSAVTTLQTSLDFVINHFFMKLFKSDNFGVCQQNFNFEMSSTL